MGRRRSKSSSKRKKKKEKTFPLDKISNLPSDVIQHILSYLHFKEAVKTSVLSKAWRHKWAMLPSLAFDDTVGSSIERIVNHVLFSHTGPVDAFKLSTAKGFRVLKGLHIRRVTVAQDALEKLIESGPLLERMTLCDITRLTQLNIYAQNLQFLKVGGVFQDFRLKNTTKLVDVSIDGKWDSSEFFKFFLQLPIIERLTIKFKGSNRMRLNQPYWNCRFTQLQVLKVTGYFGLHTEEVEFIRSVLSSSPVLKRIALQPVSGTNVCWELPIMLNDFGNVEKNFLAPLTDYYMQSNEYYDED
ncbi:putative F-box/LRR-repeat protein At3g58920 isoform X2 [Rosa chinensis]|uniref:putative F-box/LRR-repeat protein At3g58920 isoform X2 n=1 Tax=Rosa chinensis TaxID=74649 RepID=UPI001AD8D4B3|nr:putative F-box/LRR-repeat protein At3g58920 isoform X2 [Rosa chinensis]